MFCEEKELVSMMHREKLSLNKMVVPLAELSHIVQLNPGLSSLCCWLPMQIPKEATSVTNPSAVPTYRLHS